MARPAKPGEEKVLNAGFGAYPREISAIKKVARARKFRAPFDYVRHLVIADNDPFSRGKIAEPRRIKSQSSNPGPALAPSTARP
jgi:hypothetical protein